MAVTPSFVYVINNSVFRGSCVNVPVPAGGDALLQLSPVRDSAEARGVGSRHTLFLSLSLWSLSEEDLHERSRGFRATYPGKTLDKAGDTPRSLLSPFPWESSWALPSPWKSLSILTVGGGGLSRRFCLGSGGGEFVTGARYTNSIK